jgi:hypothetical protein
MVKGPVEKKKIKNHFRESKLATGNGSFIYAPTWAPSL